MKTIILSVNEQTAINFRQGLLNEDGFSLSKPLGKIYLETGKDYYCTVINDMCINFPYSMEDTVLSTFELRDLVRTGVLTIKEP